MSECCFVYLVFYLFLFVMSEFTRSRTIWHTTTVHESSIFRPTGIVCNIFETSRRFIFQAVLSFRGSSTGMEKLGCLWL